MNKTVLVEADGEGNVKFRKPLLEDENGGCLVAVSHKELDDLIGRLMSMFELNGDATMREAQKREAKFICRDWLDYIYADSGYSNYTIEKGARIVSIK